MCVFMCTRQQLIRVPGKAASEKNSQRIFNFSSIFSRRRRHHLLLQIPPLLSISYALSPGRASVPSFGAEQHKMNSFSRIPHLSFHTLTHSAADRTKLIEPSWRMAASTSKHSTSCRQTRESSSRGRPSRPSSSVHSRLREASGHTTRKPPVSVCPARFDRSRRGFVLCNLEATEAARLLLLLSNKASVPQRIGMGMESGKTKRTKQKVQQQPQQSHFFFGSRTTTNEAEQKGKGRTNDDTRRTEADDDGERERENLRVKQRVCSC